MIDIQTSWNAPEVRTDFSNVMEQIEEIMLASAQLNIMMGGRPPFNVRQPNTTPLIGSGRMYKGITGEHDSQSATVYMDKGVVSKTGFFYPKSLNDGAEIPEVSGKLMVFEIDGHTVFTYHRKGYTRQAYPFMIFQEQDKVRILQLYGDAIFIQNGQQI